MSTTLAATITAYSFQSAKSTTQYGTLSVMPFQPAKAGTLCGISIAKIPKNATITSAFLRFQNYTTVSGSYTVQVYRCTGAWPSVKSWAKRPALSAVLGSKTVAAPKTSAAFDVDITATVQQMVAGTIANNGFYASISGSTALRIRGTKASSGAPSFHVTYTVPPAAPANLEPSAAAVPVDKPVLMFDADPNVTALEVQIDPAANTAAPAWDSGTVNTTGGLLDLSGTTYPGLAEGG